MSFIIDVGSDLFGTKVNITLSFNHHPSVAEVTAACESNFDTKGRAIRPAGYPDVPFKVETFQLFDDTLLRWVDLYNEQQLKTGAQLWCFQPESIWHSDAQGVIPQPEKTSVTWSTPLGSPRRARIAADAGVPPTLSEKLRSVFYQIDGSNKGYLVYADLERAFSICEMSFNNGTAGDLFTLADQNRSQHITYDEWVNFAVKCPGIVDALFFRMRDMGPASSPHSPPGMDAQTARQTELRKMYNDSWQTNQRPQQEREFEDARQREVQRKKEDAERAIRDHDQALGSAQIAAQQHAQQHAAARQAASEQSAAMDAAQSQLQAAEQAAQSAAAQEAAARSAHEQAMSSRATAERMLQSAQMERASAQQQADAEAAAQYAAEQHAAQEQEAKRQAAAAMHAAEQEMNNTSQAQNAARAAAQAAHEAQQAQASAQAAMAQAQQLKDQAAYEQQQLNSIQPPAPIAMPPAPVAAPMPPAPQHAAPQHGDMMQHHTPTGDGARRDYESAKRRADELRRKKEEVCCTATETVGC